MRELLNTFERDHGNDRVTWQMKVHNELFELESEKNVLKGSRKEVLSGHASVAKHWRRVSTWTFIFACNFLSLSQFSLNLVTFF